MSGRTEGGNVERCVSRPLEVRIDRNPTTFEIPLMPGVYPVGEGAGYAGGIVTAAVDGLRAARKIVAKHRCPENA